MEGNALCLELSVEEFMFVDVTEAADRQAVGVNQGYADSHRNCIINRRVSRL